MTDRKRVIRELESLRDICNAKSNMAIGNGKIAWAGYANAADDALALLKEQLEIVRCKDCKYCESPNAERDWCKKGHLHRNAQTWFCADGEVRQDE